MPTRGEQRVGLWMALWIAYDKNAPPTHEHTSNNKDKRSRAKVVASLRRVKPKAPFGSTVTLTDSICLHPRPYRLCAEPQAGDIPTRRIPLGPWTLPRVLKKYGVDVAREACMPAYIPAWRTPSPIHQLIDPRPIQHLELQRSKFLAANRTANSESLLREVQSLKSNKNLQTVLARTPPA